MRMSVDVGGTFTDLVAEVEPGAFQLFKAPTTPEDPVIGVLDVLRSAAAANGTSLRTFLSRVEMFFHATTIATNAILTKSTARTAFLTTEGHPDILLYREGGRIEPFNNTVPFPDPYVPRRLTFEIPERIDSAGRMIRRLDEQAVLAIIGRLRELRIEAVGVCLLWSMVEPRHELRIGELLETHLPSVPFTLSHKLNPAIREYRRASSTCIDASLKPLITSYLRNLRTRLRDEGFGARLLTVSSLGSVVDADYMASAPIHSVKSGPSIAPIAGRHYAIGSGKSDTAIVADSGGTSYDVTLIHQGEIPFTRETWLGMLYRGHMTGFPSVDVKSIGAGGGSIAWVDDGGMLHIGPQSAGSVPGPACYGKGGVQPTVTDAALTLGYLDPDFFLDGAIRLDVAAATHSVARDVAARLGISVTAAANAILELATENMVRAIEDITINQGIDPKSAVLIGGGGAAGLNAVRIARRLGCPRVIIPPVGATLSAASALMSDLSTEFSATQFTTSNRFDFDAVNRTLLELERQCWSFVNLSGAGSLAYHISFFAEARYPHQIWEVEVPVKCRQFASPADVRRLVEALHRVHERRFSFRDADSEIEVVTWRARVTCRLPRPEKIEVVGKSRLNFLTSTRSAYFPELGPAEASVFHIDALKPRQSVVGPAIIESSFTTIVVEPKSSVELTDDGSLSIGILD
jgi:N-methylhydantoinase A